MQARSRFSLDILKGKNLGNVFSRNTRASAPPIRKAEAQKSHAPLDPARSSRRPGSSSVSSHRADTRLQKISASVPQFRTIDLVGDREATSIVTKAANMLPKRAGKYEIQVQNLIESKYPNSTLSYQRLQLNGHIFWKACFYGRQSSKLEIERYPIQDSRKEEVARKLLDVLEFTQVSESDRHLRDLRSIINEQFKGYRLCFKYDKDGDFELLVVHPICGARVKRRSKQNAIKVMEDYQNHIFLRRSKTMFECDWELNRLVEIAEEKYRSKVLQLQKPGGGYQSPGERTTVRVVYHVDEILLEVTGEGFYEAIHSAYRRIVELEKYFINLCISDE